MGHRVALTALATVTVAGVLGCGDASMDREITLTGTTMVGSIECTSGCRGNDSQQRPHNRLIEASNSAGRGCRFGFRLTGQSISCGTCLPAVTMDGEWYSSTPGGREVIVQRRGELWLVRCGDMRVLNRNLDVALMNAIRADHESAAHSDEADYPAWARAAADEIDSTA